MAALQKVPAPSMSIQAFPLAEENASINRQTHLSGMTLTDSTINLKNHNTESSPLASNQSKAADLMHSKRSSRASVSTTNSELRQTNSMLVEMLQNMQAELQTHRQILLNIQNRVTSLEPDPKATLDAKPHEPSPQVTYSAPDNQTAAPRRDSHILAPEAADWWQTCQNFARNSDTPMSAQEFLRTPHRFSGFDFKWDAPNTSSSHPPDLEDIPPLTPTSDQGESSGFGSPLDQNVFLGGEYAASHPRIATPVDDVGTDIKECIVEFDKRTLPSVPNLQPAPGARPTLVRNETMISATEPELVECSHRFFKGVKSLVTYKALLKQKSSDKGE